MNQQLKKYQILNNNKINLKLFLLNLLFNIKIIKKENKLLKKEQEKQ